ncbi:YigZ family protein [Ruminococcaceae bacterium OttesenSCG-928-I18]|nr:YigZ family protein [Ruminococcaceae bacterium OttesenSCG-928-I18]
MADYQTLAGAVSAKITVKKSEFIALAAPVKSEEEALAVLARVKEEHRTARHHVYAYCLRKEARKRYSDDGEPAKTAGLPVLSVIEGAEIQDCIIVVTRYFGGTLLGTGGLVRAYTSAAQAALQSAEIQQVRQCVKLCFSMPYPLYEQAERILQAACAQLAPPEYTDVVYLEAVLPCGEETPVLEKLQELSRGGLRIEVSEPFFTPFSVTR